jgi:hypothetical protein
MMPRIAGATARPDHTVEIVWAHGGRDVIDFRPIIAAGGVMTALADSGFFASAMRVEPDGYGLGWPSEPAEPDEVGGIDFSARGLWYRAHPDDLRRDTAA